MLELGGEQGQLRQPAGLRVRVAQRGGERRQLERQHAQRVREQCERLLGVRDLVRVRVRARLRVRVRVSVSVRVRVRVRVGVTPVSLVLMMGIPSIAACSAADTCTAVRGGGRGSVT